MRKCGILAHPTSFPSPYGIGDFGEGAYDFIDFLKKSGGALWQILPLGYTSFGDSPYQSFSTFAGNTYLISPLRLYEDGLLAKADIIPPLDDFAKDDSTVDYGKVIAYKDSLLRKAYKNFMSDSGKKLKTAYKTFCDKNSSWINDFCLFMALKNHFINERKNAGRTDEYKAFASKNNKLLTKEQIDDYYYGATWSSWPYDISSREQSAVKKWTAALKKEIGFYSFGQFIFATQWKKVKDYANKNGISVIGDIPIFVAMDSADTWSCPKLFNLKENGEPAYVAGVPPDYFSPKGQLWGNPIYDWAYHKETGYSWWKQRIKSALSMVDILRIDHFRGFESYWRVKYGRTDAVVGSWVKGPGMSLFNEIKREMGVLPIIAEDLGIITDAVRKLRDDCGFPGMRVLQFGFDNNPLNEHLPHNYPSTNIVVYSGTHDNDTTNGWYASLPESYRDVYRRYLNVNGNDPAWDLIRLAYSSVAETAVIPLQDILRLDSGHRMNKPGIAAGNWRFRYTKGMLTDDLAGGLKYFAQMYARCADQ